jgi:uncharacterized protein (DUF1697 family)
VASSRVAVLLRGVNVGRAKRIAMSDFADLLTEVGVRDVRTLLNSGNAVGTWGSTTAALEQAVAGAMPERVGFSCDVVVRTREQVAAALDADPWGERATNPSWYLVVFLGSTPTAEAVARLAALDVAPDEWELVGHELHVWMPDAVNASPVGKHLAKGVLGVTWTGRNVTTVRKLLDLM